MKRNWFLSGFALLVGLGHLGLVAAGDNATWRQTAVGHAHISQPLSLKLTSPRLSAFEQGSRPRRIFIQEPQWEGCFKNQSFAEMRELSARETAEFAASFDDYHNLIASFTSGNRFLNLQLVMLGLELDEFIEPTENYHRPTYQEQFAAAYRAELSLNQTRLRETSLLPSSSLEGNRVSVAVWLTEPNRLSAKHVLGGWIGFQMPI